MLAAGALGLLAMQHRPRPKAHPLMKSKIHAANVSQIALPTTAVAPSMDWIRALATKKRTKSKMKAMRQIAAAAPEMQDEKQVMENSRMWARRPKMAETPASAKAITWRNRA